MDDVLTSALFLHLYRKLLHACYPATGLLLVDTHIVGSVHCRQVLSAVCPSAPKSSARYC